MKTKFAFIIALLIATVSFGQQPDFINERGPIKKVVFKNRIIVSGYMDHDVDEENYIGDTNLIYNVVIKDSKGDSIIPYQLLTDDGDKYMLKNNGDSLVLERMIDIMDDDMHGSATTAISCMVLKINPDGSIYKSDFRYCFKSPKLNKFQKDSIDKVCKWIQDSVIKSKKKMNYDTDPGIGAL